MFCHMKILSVLLCLLLFHQNASTKEKKCPPGQRRIYNTDICENCKKNQYKSNSGSDIYCYVCSRCEEENFSRVVSECTLTQNAVCGCMPGFTPLDKEKLMSCFCEKGSGLENSGKKCSKCKEGYYTDKQDMICRKWKECKQGIKFPGNSTSDVVCNDASEKVINVPVASTTLTPMSTTTASTTTVSTTTASTTTSISSTTSSNTVMSPPHRDSFHIWLVMVCVVLFLMGLFTLYHKCRATRCVHNHTKVHSRKESVCRKPVEESGEKCLSLLV